MTIFASTWASTLQLDGQTSFGSDKTRRNPCLVFPNEQSTQPRSGPKVSMGCLISNAALPSNLNPCLRASTTNSFSGIDGDGGLISDGGWWRSTIEKWFA